MTLKIRVWKARLSVSGAEQVAQTFRDALGTGLMTHSEIASAIGVTQPTVSRWAKGPHEPSLEQMGEVIGLLRERAQLVSSQIEAAGELLSLTSEIEPRHSAGEPKQVARLVRRIERLLEGVVEER